ncbi:MAG: type II toxin-antitoxin system RelE/ParE family toxin [Planctomycetes bacterium]|nr:type II toxin-antitoxin system RelE/ParE family toxin [Planctomycetota bacterium]
MTPVQFEPEALDELDAVYCYYESLSPGLGDRLKLKVREKLSVMSEHPEAYPVWEGRVRRTTLHAFPYSIYYRCSDDDVRVIAVLYASADPEHVARRIVG